MQKGIKQNKSKEEKSKSEFSAGWLKIKSAQRQQHEMLM